MLEKIRIVLVNTSHPGNIGATARAMKTMGLSQLYLVDPKIYPHAEASTRAAGADDVLAEAKVVDELADAIEGCSLVFATSARSRSIPWPMLDARQGGERIIAENHDGEVAILFGREKSGLNNEELQLCDFHIQIPGNPEYSVVNLASAVQIICYEIRMHMGNKKTLSPGHEVKLAKAEEMEMFYEHLREALIAIDFLDSENPRKIMTRLRRLFTRAHVDYMEWRLLRGIMTAILKKNSG